MPETIAQVKFVHICAGRKNGECFPRENAEEVWKHLKGYRRKGGYAHVAIREVTCLGICKNGPCLSVIDENAEETLHRLGAQNVDDAKIRLDNFMDDYVINKIPPVGVSQ